jgi:predicted Rossmann fold flavoprotein
VRECLVQLKQEAARKQLANYRPLNLPQRLWHYLLSVHNIDGEKRWADVSKMELQRLTQGLTHSTYSVQGKGVFKDEFVTCGGVDLKNVNFKTMESRISPGLYFAGEILDIDGVTGGFNFQSAWTTGWLAAQGITG